MASQFRFPSTRWRRPTPPLPATGSLASPPSAAQMRRRRHSSTATATASSFLVDSHRSGQPGETIMQYFQKRYGVWHIHYKSLNCLQVGTPQRPKFLLLEDKNHDFLAWILSKHKW